MLARLTSVLIVLLATAATVSAQRKMDAEDVCTLLECGFGEREIMEVLKKDGTTLVFERDDLTLLQSKNAPAALVEWIRDLIEKSEASARPLDFDAILALVKEETAEETIRRTVLGTNTRLELTVRQILDLAHAGASDDLLKFLRERRPDTKAKSPERKITRDDVIKLTAMGVSAEKIIAQIRDTDSRFMLATEDILTLDKNGIDRIVLKEMYARNTAPPVAATDTHGAGSSGTKAPSASQKLRVYKDDSGAFSLLAPRTFIPSKEFQGRKSLIQMISSAPGEGRDLPDLELSVLRVHPKDDDRTALVGSNLGPVAQRFVDGMRQRFKNDGILVASRPAERTWLSNLPAVRINTTATTPSGTGHVGAHYIVFSSGRIYVISYSCRLELSHEWKPVLDVCARSIAFQAPTDAVLPVPAEGTDEVQLQALFDGWRTAVGRFDYATYRSLHGDVADEAEHRRAFASLARGIAEGGKRIEVGVITPTDGQIVYNVFGVDGKVSGKLGVVRAGGSWRLLAR